MVQVDIHAERSALASPGMSPQSDASVRDRITATIIREEAAESLLPGIQNDAELVALNQVLNRYPASWWVQHLSRVGGDPAGYWREQLGDEIKVATRGKTCSSRKKKISLLSLRNPAAGVTYDLSRLDLIPL